MQENENKRAVIGRLKFRVWGGIIYILGAVVWLLAAYRDGNLDSPVTYLWLVGSLIFLVVIAVNVRKMSLAREGDPDVMVEPDERKEFITRRAGNSSFWWMMITLCGSFGGLIGARGEIPIDTLLYILVGFLIYAGHFLYYLRKYG